jgi:hypothetical protein
MVTGGTIADEQHEWAGEARQLPAVLPETSLRLMTLQEAVAIERTRQRPPVALAKVPAAGLLAKPT